MKADFDSLPPAVRTVIRDSNNLGSDVQRVIAVLAPARTAVLVDRLRRADNALNSGSNLNRFSPLQLAKASRILKGLDDGATAEELGL